MTAEQTIAKIGRVTKKFFTRFSWRFSTKTAHGALKFQLVETASVGNGLVGADKYDVAVLVGQP